MRLGPYEGTSGFSKGEHVTCEPYGIEGVVMEPDTDACGQIGIRRQGDIDGPLLWINPEKLESTGECWC